MWLALNDPTWADKDHTPHEQERIVRYNVHQIAKLYGQLPEAVLGMDVEWFHDALLFEATMGVTKAQNGR